MGILGCSDAVSANASPVPNGSPGEFSRGTAEPGWSMLAVINPCNPTGEYMSIEEMRSYIQRSVETNNAAAGGSNRPCTVLVDESMQLWRGEDWREDSLVSQDAWVKEMFHLPDSFLDQNMELSRYPIGKYFVSNNL